MLYIGCAVWAYDGWANSFFPPGLPKDERLRAYSRRLTAVEANSTFYAMPPLSTVQKWAAETPESFRFCPKFPKAISHTAGLKMVKAQTASFLGVMRTLGPRLGPLMLQLPPGFGPSRLGVLRDYLEALPGHQAIAVEVRHKDWFTEDNGKVLDDTLKAFGIARVVFDVRPAHNSTAPEAISAQERKPAVPLIAEVTQPFVVVRFISSPIMEENEPYFAEWIPRLAAWLKEDRRVYFFVHCPQEEHSPAIARELYRRLSQVVEIPPLPWDEAENPTTPTSMTQLSLF